MRRLSAIGLFWLVTIIVLVLSKAVLVIVIDVSMNLRAGRRDTIEFHRHLGQHHDNPIAHPFHRGIVLNVDSVGPQQHVLDGGTRRADIKLVSITSTSTVAGATEHEHEFLMHNRRRLPQADYARLCFSY